jgi:hypothetical protein
MAERKYAMTKLEAGDYLLPSNDGETIFRIHRYVDGPSFGLLDWPRDKELWGAYRWEPRRKGEMPETAEDLDDWDLWGTVATTCETRKAAIDAALDQG